MQSSRSIGGITEDTYELCDTLFYQGNGCSQTHALKYIGDQEIIATTGELMWCSGKNNLEPLKVIYNLHIGKEIADVNLHPFSDFISHFNPINVIGSICTFVSNWRNGFHFNAESKIGPESVVFHAPIISEISIGQESDMLSHREKYNSWLTKKDKTDGLILWGVSRGTAATFCTFAKEKYPEVKLVVLEGAIDSVEEVLPKRVANVFKSEYLSDRVTHIIKSGFRLFNKWNMIQYSEDGPSPLKSVDEFPEGIPVVFITSEVDTIVSCMNTQNIAHKLAEQGKNDVYLLKLKHSSHPNYMFDDRDDRDRYETFIHAIYKKYNLKHDSALAEKGESMIEQCTLFELSKYNGNDHNIKLAV